MRLFYYRLLFLFFINAIEGCTLISGSRPIPVSAMDRLSFDQAETSTRFSIPLITHPIGDRPIKQFVIGFDGTMNDRNRVPKGENKTIVASILDRIGGTYYPGPGMQNPHFMNVVDGMIGYSSANIAENAADEILIRIRAWIREYPECEVRILVTGFSRGAAIARHFMNAVDAATTEDPNLRRKVYFYAILFDTVSIAPFESLNLSIPPSLDYLVHFVASDESRFFFRPTIDVAPAIVTRVFNLRDPYIPKRINLIKLPGSHSDIGGAYQMGIGLWYLQLTEQLLHQMGIIEQNCWDEKGIGIDASKHDSRGFLDRLFGTAPPNSDATVARTLLSVPFVNPLTDRVEENSSRLAEMSYANAKRGAFVWAYRTEIEAPRLTLLRQGENIEVLNWEPANYIDGSTFKFSKSGRIRLLSYRFLPPLHDRESTLPISDDIWYRLPEGRPALLSYGLLADGDKDEMTAFVDNVISTSSISSNSEQKPKKAPRIGCNSGVEIQRN